MSASAAARGIVAASASQQQRFEDIIHSFGVGYRAGLWAKSSARLAGELDETEISLRGFAYEGAGMGLTVREALNPWSDRLVGKFLSERAAPFTYLVHVGVGWAFGLVPGARRLFAQLDPLLRWLAFDGEGFREFFFASNRSRQLMARHPFRPELEARVRDQGLGRCLWFVAAANPGALNAWLARFPADRHDDLWAGIGLAAVYAGRPTEAEGEMLVRSAQMHRAALAQGAAFAARALVAGGQLIPAHDTVCFSFLGRSACDAARITDDALDGLRPEEDREAYQRWRLDIQQRLWSGFTEEISR